MSGPGEMVNCTHCAASIEATAVYCRYCFSGLSANYFRNCPICQESIRRDAEACRFCSAVIPEDEVYIRIPQDEAQVVAQFRQTFLAEIENLFSYNLKIGDALFMVVNIVGKALQVDRCAVYCTDSEYSLWTYAEYWDRELVKGCRELNWRPSQSAMVARAVLTTEPINYCEGDKNPGSARMQEEINLLEIKALLAVPLSIKARSQGCLILQNCNQSRVWTDDEILWIEQVGQALAKALIALDTSDPHRL